MSTIILVTGGSRSGKSAHALRLAESRPGPWTFVATCPAIDEEMAKKIEVHRQERDARTWTTIEEEIDLAGAIARAGAAGVILVDCLTLWVNNLMYRASLAGREVTEQEVAGLTDVVVRAARSAPGTVIFVTNEVGLGIVPPDRVDAALPQPRGTMWTGDRGGSGRGGPGGLWHADHPQRRPGDMKLLETTCAKIAPLDAAAQAEAKTRLDQLTMPHWALGRLMDLALELAGITGSARPPVARKTVVVMAGRPRRHRRGGQPLSLRGDAADGAQLRRRRRGDQRAGAPGGRRGAGRRHGRARRSRPRWPPPGRSRGSTSRTARRTWPPAPR